MQILSSQRVLCCLAATAYRPSICCVLTCTRGVHTAHTIHPNRNGRILWMVGCVTSSRSSTSKQVYNVAWCVRSCQRMQPGFELANYYYGFLSVCVLAKGMGIAHVLMCAAGRQTHVVAQTSNLHRLGKSVRAIKRLANGLYSTFTDDVHASWMQNSQFTPPPHYSVVVFIFAIFIQTSCTRRHRQHTKDALFSLNYKQ